MNKPRPTFMSDFRTFFVRGLAILLPSVLTIWIVVQAYRFVDERFAEPINAGVRELVIWSTPRLVDSAHQPDWFEVPEKVVAEEQNRRETEGLPSLSNAQVRKSIRRRNLGEWWSHHPALDLIGLFVAIALFYLAGRIFGGFLGRRIAGTWESALARVPIFKQVFPYVKQIVEFVLGERQLEFKRVAMIEYPRKGVWSIGFVTGSAMRGAIELTGKDMVTVFIPSSPTPFTGYTVTVYRSEVIEIDITVEEALRFTVSGGVLLPASERLDPDEVRAMIRGQGERPTRTPEARPTDEGSGTDLEVDRPAGTTRGD